MNCVMVYYLLCDVVLLLMSFTAFGDIGGMLWGDTCGILRRENGCCHSPSRGDGRILVRDEDILSEIMEFKIL